MINDNWKVFSRFKCELCMQQRMTEFWWSQIPGSYFSVQLLQKHLKKDHGVNNRQLVIHLGLEDLGIICWK